MPGNQRFAPVRRERTVAAGARRDGGTGNLQLIGIGLVFCCATLVATAAAAKPVSCVANLAGIPTLLGFDTETVEYRTLRERWSPLAPNCPSDAIIAKLKPDLAPELRPSYCLLTDPADGAYLAVIVGEADRFGRCPETGAICKAVNSAASFALDTVGGIGSTILGSDAALSQAGMTRAANPSAGMILTGTSSLIGGALGNVGATAVSVVSAPEVLIGAAAGAVVIGGAILVCGE